MYGWLISRAESLCPQGRERSVVPAEAIAPDDLRALNLIGSQELPDELVEHSPVVRLIQATLTDMDESERLTLLRRYHRIDRRSEGDGESVNSADLPGGDQLVRARYYFRRCLFGRIHALDPEIGEFGADTRTAVFEKNLEKIFCSMEPFQKLPEGVREDLENEVVRLAEQIKLDKKAGGASFRKTAWILAIVTLLFAAGIGLFFMHQRRRPIPPSVPAVNPIEVEAEVNEAERKPAGNEMSPREMEAYLIRIFEAGSAGDMETLIEALERGPFPAQVAAAIYLGRIGDESAMGPLSKAAEQWYAENLGENPFLTAIEQIEQRLLQQQEQEEAERQAETEADEAAEVEGELIEALPEESIAPSEPNEPDDVVPDESSPAEINEPDWVEGTDPNQIEQEDQGFEDPNEPEEEWSEEEYETDQVQYIGGDF